VGKYYRTSVYITKDRRKSTTKKENHAPPQKSNFDVDGHKPIAFQSAGEKKDFTR
jgi:hypothetical protein